MQDEVCKLMGEGERLALSTQLASAGYQVRFRKQRSPGPTQQWMGTWITSNLVATLRQQCLNQGKTMTCRLCFYKLLPRRACQCPHIRPAINAHYPAGTPLPDTQESVRMP